MIRAASTLAAPSHSRLAKLHECRRAYYYRYVRRLRSKAGEPTRMLAGKALHAALDILYRRGFNAIDDAHRAIIAMYGNHAPSDKLDYITAEHLMGIAVRYVHRWPLADDELQPLRLHRSQLESNAAVLAFYGDYDDDGYACLAEAPMVVQLSPTLAMTVIIDMVAQRSDGSIIVVDHKSTCSYLGKGVLNKYIVSHQPPLYIHAVRAIVGRCDGAVLNAIYMGEHALKPASKAVKFDRYTFDYTEGQLAESLAWAQGTLQIATVEEAEHLDFFELEDESMWLQNPSSYCAGCDYLPLCEVGPAMRQGRIDNWYTVEDEDNAAEDEGTVHSDA